MRTIKFRGKKLENGEWLYGDLVQDDEGGYYVYPNDCDGLYLNNRVDPYTIGQFTGLLDKNGKQIYEGDIIQGEYNHKHLIRYIEEDARFTSTLVAYVGDKYAERCNTGDVTQKWINEFNKVVIGNIYDNPELMD